MKVGRGLDGSLPLGRKIFIPLVQKIITSYILRLKEQKLKIDLTFGSRSKYSHFTTQPCPWAHKIAGTFKIPWCYNWKLLDTRHYTKVENRQRPKRQEQRQQKYIKWVYNQAFSFSLGLWLPKTNEFVLLLLQSIFFQNSQMVWFLSPFSTQIQIIWNFH